MPVSGNLRHRKHMRLLSFLAISDESTELRFAPPGEIDHLPMHRTQRLRLHHFLEHRERRYLG